MSTVPKRLLTAQEYLAWERTVEGRHEFYRGEVFAMSGGTVPHSRIGTNLLAHLSVQLRGGPCEVYNADLRILVAASGLYTYPDASVICGEPEFDDHYRDTVLNPTLLAEVLSDSTEAYDRGKKFEHYRKIPALREVLLIAQDRPSVDRFWRGPDGTWSLTSVSGLDQVIELPAIGVTLTLSELYRKVEFDRPAAS